MEVFAILAILLFGSIIDGTAQGERENITKEKK